MAARSIASFILSFGLVSIPVRLYSATETAAIVKFNLLAKDGSRVKQQYVSEKDESVVARADMAILQRDIKSAKRSQELSFNLLLAVL